MFVSWFTIIEIFCVSLALSLSILDGLHPFRWGYTPKITCIASFHHANNQSNGAARVYLLLMFTKYWHYLGKNTPGNRISKRAEPTIKWYTNVFAFGICVMKQTSNSVYQTLICPKALTYCMRCYFYFDRKKLHEEFFWLSMKYPEQTLTMAFCLTHRWKCWISRLWCEYNLLCVCTVHVIIVHICTPLRDATVVISNAACDPMSHTQTEFD